MASPDMSAALLLEPLLVLACTNPGSVGHPHCCKKPCNKYVKGRPGSCKHGAACNFCHEEHHRRVMKSLSARIGECRTWYEQNREDLDSDVAPLYNGIYVMLQQCVEDALKLLGGEDESKLAAMEQMLRMKGVQAQMLRPIPVQSPLEPLVRPSSEASVREQLRVLQGLLHLGAKQWLALGLTGEEVLQKLGPALDSTKMITMLQCWGHSSL